MKPNLAFYKDIFAFPATLVSYINGASEYEKHLSASS